MARIYSWQLTDTKFAYITGVKDNEPFVGNRLNAEDYEVLTNKVEGMSLSEYDANFEKVCELCEQYGVDPTKEGTHLATAFYDTTSSTLDFMVVLAGKDGKDGAKGEKGEKGEKGDPGVTPDTPIPYISITAYCSTGNRDVRPDTPQEGDIIIKWDPNTKQYTFKDTQGDWYLYDSEANDNDGDGSTKSIIWQSSAVYNDKGIVSPWTKPIRITGENGEPGTDGNNLEFIYQRRTHVWVNPEAPVSVNVNKDVPDKWTGSPTGIDDEWRYEYMCQRRKNDDDVWGEWEGPTVWSRWGDDGKDGDGVEYAYFTTNGTEPKVRYDVEITDPEYQTTEYRPFVQLPNSNGTYVDVKDSEGNSVRWYDNPRQIDSEDNRAQWVIIRKRRTEEGASKATWGQFSDPALWSMYGQKGDPGVEGLNVYERRMYCSHNVNDAPEITDPTKFALDFPWSPAVPIEKGDGEGIWATEAYIKLVTIKKEDGTVEYEQKLCWYDGSTEERVIDETTGEKGVPRWSVPYIIEGRAGADFVHNREEIFKCVAITLDDNGEKVPPPLPTTNEKGEDFYIPSSDGWSQYMEGLSEETPLCYMCYRERKLVDKWWGEWSDWKGPFIFTQLGSQGPAGTDGTDGTDGTNIEFIYTRTFDENPPMWYVPSEDYANGNFQTDEYKPYLNADMTLKWHDEPRGVNEGTPYEWVASRMRKYNEVSERVEWSEFSEPGIFAKYGFNGKDGKDIEYVYCMTKTDVKPKVKSYDANVGNVFEFYPEVEYDGNMSNVSANTVNGKVYWMDNAKDVSLEWPYQWEVKRERIGIPNEENTNLYDYPWTLYETENVVLHSKWGRDGDQGRQGVAGVAGIHYEMRFIQARQDEDDNIYLYVPEIKNNNFTGNFIDVHYVDDNNVEQDAWKNYWYNTKHPDIDGEDVTFLYQTRNLNRTYFPLYTDTLSAKEYPYMFFIQSRIGEERTELTWTNPNNGQTEISGYTTIEVLENGQWEAPARLTGKQGIQGPQGKRGPMLYSAGVYGTGKKYYTTDNKKPYVLDPADREYYYLEKGNFSANSDCNDGNGPDTTGMEYWYTEYDVADGSKDNLPSTNVANGGSNWVKMEQFDVILANVGIFNSALVGSGVFYGEWFYSQNGTLSDGTKSESITNADGIVVTSSRYEEFDPDTRILTKTNGGGNGTSKEPYINWGANNNFKPFLALNLMDGSGWFAGTNILWDSDGNMNIKGSGVGSFGNDAFTWDNENIYINKNLKMGPGVTISWNNVDSTKIDKDILDAIDAAKKYSDGLSSDNTFITTITENAILTDWLHAQHITANDITAAALSAHTATIGTIAAENMDVDNLYVKKLNTKGQGVYGAGTISIEENEINVYDNSKTKEVVYITGKNLETIPNEIKFPYVNKQLYTVDNFYSTLLSDGYKCVKVGSFTIPDDGFTYKASYTGRNSWSLYLSTDNFLRAMQTTIYGYIRFVVTTASTVTDGYNDYQDTYSIFSNVSSSGENMPASDTITEPSIGYEFVGSNVNNMSPGTYNVFACYEFTYVGGAQSSLVQIDATLSCYCNSINLTPDINRCEISSHGFRYIVDAGKYVEFDKNGNFTMVNGKAGVRLTSGGTLQIASNTLNDTAYQSLTWNEIKPREYKFRLQGDTNQRMTVLTIGESVSV